MITILFNSFTFLYFGLAVLVVLLAIKSKKYQYLFLLVASYYFYFVSSSYLFLLLLFSSLLDFYCGRAIYTAQEHRQRKFFLVLSLVGNLGVLGFFKYTDFVLETTNTISSWLGYSTQIPLLHLILPIGISFFTFQTMSYTLDIYFKKLTPTDSLLHFLLYVSFFPQLVAGPIVRAADFLPQLRQRIVFTESNFKSGLTLVLWGLVKKVVIADNIAIFVNAFFADPTIYPGSLAVILGALAFTIQIYCDFSAYSDIAIGVARVMGFHFHLNFNKPFFSTSIAEFWKRWHISLSSWFRDYVFAPLMKRRLSMWWLYFSVFAVYLLSGLWHGAGWNFVTWGALHGFFLMVSLSTESWRHKFNQFVGLTRVPRLHHSLRVFITLYLVVFSLLLFRIYDARFLLYSVKKFLFLDFSQFQLQVQNLLGEFSLPLLFMAVFIIIHLYTYFRRELLESIAHKDSFKWTIYLTSMILILYLFSPSESIPFIYFQF